MVGIHVVPSENQNAINVVSGENENSINIVNGNNSGSIHVSNVADFYQLAKEWAISNELVEGIDYSSKYWAFQSKADAQNAENAKDTILNNAGFIAVSSDLTNINIVATNIEDVNTVATNIADVKAVADDLTNIGIIATDLSDENSILKSVSDNITSIYSVASDLDNIDAVYDDLTDIDTVVTNISDINTVATNISDVNTVATNISDVNTVANDILKVNTVADNISGVGDVADNISNINAVNSNSTNINAVASNSSNINTVANNASNIQTVVTNITDIQNAEENAALASQSATNAATSEDNAEIWAEGTDTQVSDLGGTHSAKGWADVVASSLSNYVPYSSATGTVDLNGQDLKNVDNLAVGTSTIDSNEKILSVGQNRIVTNNNNGLFISSTTSQTRKGMYGVPMALEIQFNSNNQAYSYPLGFHDMNSNGQGGQFLFTSFSSAISAASAGDVMVENDKGGLIFNTGASKTGSKMRFTVGNWASTPQLTLTANGVGIKNLNPNSSYALDVTGIINASSDVRVNGVSVALPSQSGNSGKFLTTNGSTASWAEISTNANVQYVSGGGGGNVDLSSLYIDSYGAVYGFYYDYGTGTIRPDNIGVDESYAYAVVELYVEEATTATVYFRQSSEENYDFGEISELGQYLNMDNQEDIDYVAFSGKSYGDYEGSVEYELEAGYNTFTIKYVKDDSSESGEDLFEITAITLGSGSGGGSLIDTDTQEEIPLSQINDMPQALQSIIDQIPDISDLSNDYVTMNTSQKIQAAKAIFGTDVAFGSDTTQKNLLAVISNSNSTSGNWIGRLCVGAKNKTFIMGTYGSICVLGAHSWTNAQQGTGAAWEDVYINPDGNKAVYIGGSPINGKQAILKIQNVNANTTGTVQINRSSNLTNNFKDVACWDDNISKFNNDMNYISGITSAMVTNALGFTPYSAANPNNYTSVVESTVSGWGFTKNAGTVTSVNNVSPVNGNVSLTIPTKISDLADDTSTYPIDKADTLTNLTATVSELNYVDGVTSAIQTQLNGKQTTANLVTSVSSSSTDSQYPSAKLFYDTCGDIETLINAL